MASVQRYRVYVWKSPQSKAATVVQDVVARSVDNAINAVLLTHRMSKASYVWLICHDDDRIDVHRYDVAFELPPLASLLPQGGRSDGRHERRR